MSQPGGAELEERKWARKEDEETEEEEGDDIDQQDEDDDMMLALGPRAFGPDLGDDDCGGEFYWDLK